MIVEAFAPGRVNLIGDHTDYTGGLVLPMAIQLGTTVRLKPGGPVVSLTSDEDERTALVDLDIADPSTVQPDWGRYVAGVVAEVRPVRGGTGTVTTTLPIGAGLSSSAALEVAVALAVGFDGPPLDLAIACQRAEHLASGVPCGIMDQLASCAGVEGHALLIDCATNSIQTVRLPEGVEIVAIHSGVTRALSSSAYEARRSSCEAAEALIGPLRRAAARDVIAIKDPILRKRARHVVTENERVGAFTHALQSADLAAAGALMDESHRSLRDDFDVSTPELDDLVTRLRGTPGVFGARLTGAGFGGCAVALSVEGALSEGWHLRPSAGARVAVT